MKKFIALTALCLLAACALHAEDNPLRNAKIGDWAEYTTTTKAGGISMKQDIKETVTEKTDDEATVNMAMSVAGQDINSPIKINLKEKYNPATMGTKGAEVKELGKGEENLVINGKTIATEWHEMEVTSEAAPGQKVTSKTKVWVSKDVPVFGLARMESSIAGGNTVMELKDFGKK